jgi:hypothetical protein
MSRLSRPIWPNEITFGISLASAIESVFLNVMFDSITNTWTAPSRLQAASKLDAASNVRLVISDGRAI